MHRRTISHDNATFQVVLALKENRRKRTSRQEIFVEGVAPLNAAVNAGLTAVSVLLDQSRRLSGWARDTITALDPTELYELSEELMSRLSDRDEPSELIAILRRPAARIDDTGPAELVAILDRPSNPGNLGSLVRSANAFGVGLVITTGHGVDPYDPQVIRASRGAVFTTPMVHEESTRVLLDWIARARDAVPGLRVIGTDSSGERTLHDARPAPPLVVLFGNEATGLSRALRESVDEMVRIAIGGSVDSLNLACAASIVLHQIAINRGSAPN